MIEKLVLASLIALPFTVGLTAGYKFGGSLISIGVSVVGAVTPSILIFVMTQEADGITRAASAVLFPVLCILGLFLAGLGYLTGRGWGGA